MSTVLITGGTGLVGTALSKLLVQKGYDIIILSRNAKAGNAKTVYRRANWDIENQTIDADAIEQADYIIHLAGAGVADKRWTAKRKKEIEESRTKSSALIVKALTDIPNKVKAVVCASAIGWYGPDPSIPNPEPFIETNAPDTEFLGETCRVWEESIEPVTAMGKRLVKLRTGIVLGREGGALAAFKRPVRFGVAAILGNGKQVVSWIHIDDLCRLYAHAIERENLHGAYNAVAPNPVNNRTLTIELAKKIKGRFYIPFQVPSFILKIMLGEMSVEVLKSATVSAEKIRNTGFQFLYPHIEPALDDLI